MKVKIKVNVPKGATGVTYYGHTYGWHGGFYDMDKEYTIKKEDFNPVIMISLEPKKGEPKIEVPVEEPPTEDMTTNAEGKFTGSTTAAEKETPSLGPKKRPKK